MKKNILIIGAGPLPNDTSGIREAAGLRTHQFTQSIANTEHSITLFCIHNNSDFSTESQTPQYKNTTIIRLHRNDKALVQKIQQHIAHTPPDSIIGVNTFPAFIAAQVCPNHIPLWADLNGWIMAESQARGYAEHTNIHFANAWRQEKYILQKADKLSTVSTAQKFCTIGELASLGLLTHQNFHDELVYSIPNTTEFFSIDNRDKTVDKIVDNVDKSVDKTVDTVDKKEEYTPLFKGIKTPKNAVIISHIGGYNNWVDTQTLFTALDNAMSICPYLHFVSTGGAIKNVSASAFSQFINKINTSKHKDRYHFLGWIHTEDMYKIYKESDIGINVDFACIETETGARNRLNEMLKFQLPIITTNRSEIAKDIDTYGAGECTDSGNTEELTQKIVKMAKMAKASTLDTYKEKCLFLHTTLYSPEKCMKPIFQFIENGKKRTKENTKQASFFTFIQNGIWYIKKNGVKNSWKKFIQRFL